MGASRSHCYFISIGSLGGGVSEHLMALAGELARRCHRVVALSGGGVLPGSRTDLARLAWPSRRPVHIRDARFLGRLVRQHHPDCLMASWAAVNIMVLVGRLMRVPRRVVWYHTMSGAIDQDATCSAWLGRLQRLRKRLVYQAATTLVANSSAASADVQKTYGVPAHKCHVLHPSIPDPSAGRPAPVVPRAQNRLVCVGRFAPCKGQDVLIRAIGLLKETLPDLTAEFVGDGPLRTSLEALAHDVGVGDRCAFRGEMPREIALERMALAAVAVVPSRSEAFGLVNTEALAMGTPVVASSTGGIVDIVRDGVEGFLVPPDDADALAGKLSLLFTDPGLRRRMGIRARERFLTEFEQGACVRRQADWMERLVAANP